MIGSLTYNVLGLDSASDFGKVFAWLAVAISVILLTRHLSNSIERSAELEQIRNIQKIIEDIKEE